MDFSSAGGPRNASVDAAYALKNAHRKLSFLATCGIQDMTKSKRIKSGKPWRSSCSTGSRNSSQATIRYCTSSGCRSIVASQFSGRPLIAGIGILTRLMCSNKWSASRGSLCIFLGVEMNDTRMPFPASLLANSKYGSMCPKANQGNIITWYSLEAIGEHIHGKNLCT
ncbi:hypothetical protein MLD38_023237 [Melastoma candidum]|uniref:Uncharacterized protein n=1 Tax=Melastoma candidum TaxID=119954 RepID=A0ACB9QQT4_9MYRT|nr:hypothetical protein MLD38_023237 [Melastoma candidum]